MPKTRGLSHVGAEPGEPYEATTRLFVLVRDSRIKKLHHEQINCQKW